MSRLVWNLGFWPNPELRIEECVFSFEEAMARLFEGMILLPLGSDQRLQEWPRGFGRILRFVAVVTSPVGAELHVGKGIPGQPGRLWGDPIVPVESNDCDLRFMSFFDWDQLAPREYRWMEVRIERFDNRPDLVGKDALVELSKCSIWFEDESEAEGGSG